MVNIYLWLYIFNALKIMGKQFFTIPFRSTVEHCNSENKMFQG